MPKIIVHLYSLTYLKKIRNDGAQALVGLHDKNASLPARAKKHIVIQEFGVLCIYLKVIPRAQNTSTRCLFIYLDFLMEFFCFENKVVLKTS